MKVRGDTRWTFVELSDKSGMIGLAELTETQLSTSAVPLTAKLANKLRGERVASEKDALAVMGITESECVADQVTATAVSAIRAASADFLARRAELPLYAYLTAVHGTNNSTVGQSFVRLYANINRSLLPDDSGAVDRSPTAFAKMAQRAVEEGFSTVKCAPFDECRAPFDSRGLPLKAELGLERVRAVKEAIGEVPLYVDCHSRFDLNSAPLLERALTDEGAAWMEEPIDPLARPDDLRDLKKSMSLPLAGGEKCYGIAAFKELLQTDVLDIVMPDIKFCGGPAEAFTTGIELESTYPGSVSMHCPSGPISLLGSAHVTLAFGGSLPLEYAVYETEWRHETTEPYECIENGAIMLSDAPGLGVNISAIAVEALGKSWEP